jgi:hypothetical protein
MALVTGKVIPSGSEGMSPVPGRLVPAGENHIKKIAGFVADSKKDEPKSQGEYVAGEVVTVSFIDFTVTVKLEGSSTVVGPFPYNQALAVAVGGVMWFMRVGESLFGVSYRGPVWTTYNFTFTASTTNPTVSSASNVGRYSVANKMVFFELTLTWSPGDAVGSGAYTFGLPTSVDVKSGTFPTGTVWIRGAGVERQPTGWRLSASGTAATLFVFAPGTGSALQHNTYAWSSASPDVIAITGWAPLN